MPVNKRKPRRRMSLTSLIDVIFLLLLFFMLSSTFSRFAEVELSAASGGGTSASDSPLIFLRLGTDALDINGQTTDLENASQTVRDQMSDSETMALVSLSDGVDAQRLTDLLVALRDVSGLAITVLSPS